MNHTICILQYYSRYIYTYEKEATQIACLIIILQSTLTILEHFQFIVIFLYKLPSYMYNCNSKYYKVHAVKYFKTSRLTEDENLPSSRHLDPTTLTLPVELQHGADNFPCCSSRHSPVQYSQNQRCWLQVVGWEVLYRECCGCLRACIL